MRRGAYIRFERRRGEEGEGKKKQIDGDRHNLEPGPCLVQKKRKKGQGHDRDKTNKKASGVKEKMVNYGVRG